MILDYQSLDRIADAYIPLLGLIALGLLLTAAAKRQWRLLFKRASGLLSLLLLVYGLMLLDNALRLWPRLGLDYSTHTALALALVLFLALHLARLSLLWLGSWAAYLLLMLYQGYHTVADMIVTALVIVGPAWWIVLRCGGMSELKRPGEGVTLPASVEPTGAAMTHEQTPQAKVEIYTRRYCGFCVRAKQLLQEKGIEFSEYSIDGNAELQQQMLARAAGRYTVPQIFINGDGIGGCDELYALQHQGELDGLLSAPARD